MPVPAQLLQALHPFGISVQRRPKGMKPVPPPLVISEVTGRPKTPPALSHVPPSAPTTFDNRNRLTQMIVKAHAALNRASKLVDEVRATDCDGGAVPVGERVCAVAARVCTGARACVHGAAC